MANAFPPHDGCAVPQIEEIGELVISCDVIPPESVNVCFPLDLTLLIPPPSFDFGCYVLPQPVVDGVATGVPAAFNAEIQYISDYCHPEFHFSLDIPACMELKQPDVDVEEGADAGDFAATIGPGDQGWCNPEFTFDISFPCYLPHAITTETHLGAAGALEVTVENKDLASCNLDWDFDLTFPCFSPMAEASVHEGGLAGFTIGTAPGSSGWCSPEWDFSINFPCYLPTAIDTGVHMGGGAAALNVAATNEGVSTCAINWDFDLTIPCFSPTVLITVQEGPEEPAFSANVDEGASGFCDPAWSFDITFPCYLPHAITSAAHLGADASLVVTAVNTEESACAVDWDFDLTIPCFGISIGTPGSSEKILTNWYDDISVGSYARLSVAPGSSGWCSPIFDFDMSLSPIPCYAVTAAGTVNQRSDGETSLSIIIDEDESSCAADWTFTLDISAFSPGLIITGDAGMTGSWTQGSHGWWNPDLRLHLDGGGGGSGCSGCSGSAIFSVVEDVTCDLDGNLTVTWTYLEFVNGVLQCVRFGDTEGPEQEVTGDCECG